MKDLMAPIPRVEICRAERHTLRGHLRLHIPMLEFITDVIDGIENSTLP